MGSVKSAVAAQDCEGGAGSLRQPSPAPYLEGEIESLQNLFLAE
jgi:hypothetical protein